MALLWIDGFDHYETANNNELTTTEVFGSYAYASFPFFHSTSGVIGGCVYTDIDSANNTGPYFTLPADTATVGVGFHFMGTETSTRGLVAILSNTLTQIYSISYSPTSGNIYLRDGGENGSTLATSSSSYPPDVWHHLEVKFHLDSTGSIEVRVNGQTAFLYTGNTASSGLQARRISFGSSGSGAGGARKNFFDNLFIWDTTGSENNDWLGERNVYTVFPDSDTATADWSLSTGSDGYALIDEVPPNTTDYIEAATASLRSNFGVSALPTTDITISGVKVTARAQKTGTADTEISLGVTSNAATSDSGNLPLTQDEYKYVHAIFETDPGTTSAWDPLDISSLEVGIERTV